MAAFAGMALMAATFAFVVWRLNDQFREAQAEWALERRELLTRIQRPEYAPTTPVAQFEVPELEPDDYNRVGTVRISDDYGLSDE